MEPARIGSEIDLEEIIQEAIVKELKLRDWHVMITHGNLYQKGFPDLRVSHPEYGPRWLEVKRPVGYHFTRAQLIHFPKMCCHRDFVWIATTHIDVEDVLLGEYNWYKYLPVVQHNSIMIRTPRVPQGLARPESKGGLLQAILKQKGR